MAFKCFQELLWLPVPPGPPISRLARSRRGASFRSSPLPLSARRAEGARPSARTADAVEGVASMTQNKRFVRMPLRVTAQPSRCAA